MIDNEVKCISCKFVHCGYNPNCELISTKMYNKYKKLNNYVYNNLKHYGNALIGQATYEILGEDVIIKDIKGNGFKNVKIRKVDKDSYIITGEEVKI